jgi:hypothetical protein
MSHAPIEEDLCISMNAVAFALDDVFKGKGFCLLVFDVNTTEGRINYVSNVDRGDMICAMKEFIASCEGRVMEPPEGVIQ